MYAYNGGNTNAAGLPIAAINLSAMHAVSILLQFEISIFLAIFKRCTVT
jgi:hypothetical protein